MIINAEWVKKFGLKHELKQVVILSYRSSNQSLTIKNWHILADLFLLGLVEFTKNNQIIIIAKLGLLGAGNDPTVCVRHHCIPPSLSGAGANVVCTTLGTANHHTLTVQGTSL